MIRSLRAGEPVVVMGPTGTPTEIPRGTDVLLAGGGLGNAVLFSIAKALRENGNRVLYFAGYKKGEDLFKREDIEALVAQSQKRSAVYDVITNPVNVTVEVV